MSDAPIEVALSFKDRLTPSLRCASICVGAYRHAFDPTGSARSVLDWISLVETQQEYEARDEG
jgi:hypothetical protein